jgi:type VI secretion system protein ImpE
MSDDIKALLDADQLNEAISVMNGMVRAKPKDIDCRANLVELLCYSGNLERADKLLDAITELDPTAAVGVALFRQLVRAEQARVQFYEEGRLPEFVAKPDPLCELELRASVLLREGDEKGAAALIEERDSLRRPVAGTTGGEAFDDFRDLDDVNASHLEVLTSTGKYFWTPVSAVQEIEFRAPQRRRDLIWRRAALSISGGPDGEIFVPAIYVAKDSAAAQRLGHVTDYVGGDDTPVRGLGLRSFLVGDDSKTIMELGSLKFAPATVAA